MVVSFETLKAVSLATLELPNVEKNPKSHCAKVPKNLNISRNKKISFKHCLQHKSYLKFLYINCHFSPSLGLVLGAGMAVLVS